MHESYPTPGPIRVDVSVPSGSIEIEATATEETTVDLEISDELRERTTVELRGDTLRVQVKDRVGLFSFTREPIHLRVRCPEGSSLAVQTKSARVAAAGRLGDVRMQSASGDATLDRAASLDFQSASGDVTATEIAGSTSVQVVSGDVRLRDAHGDVRVQSVSGDVAVERVVEGDARFESVSGDVHVGIARGSRVHVDAFTLSGDTRSELELGESTGDGGPLVRLRAKTVSGDVAVVRADAPTPQEV